MNVELNRHGDANESRLIASHEEIVTGLDTTLATSLRRAEEILVGLEK